MGESAKAVCALLLIAASIAAVFAWFADQPDTITWTVRFGCPLMAVLALGFILLLHFRADAVPDYLHRQAGSYFNRNGFCFALTAVPIDGICHFVAYFQNQRDRPCVGRIALRPARGFFGRADIAMAAFEIRCEPAAFGWCRLPVPLNKKLQGKRQSFEVGASVEYPEGKGKRLRFRDGIFLRANSNFGNRFTTALIAAGALGGTIVLTRPASTVINLPSDVAEDVSGDRKPEIKTLWRLGDPERENPS